MKKTPRLLINLHKNGVTICVGKVFLENSQTHRAAIDDLMGRGDMKNRRHTESHEDTTGCVEVTIY